MNVHPETKKEVLASVTKAQIGGCRRNLVGMGPAEVLILEEVRPPDLLYRLAELVTNVSLCW
jgi:hypothetical protein